VHFCLSFYYNFILVITCHYHFIPALAEYQHVLNLAIFPLLLKPTAQNERMDWNSLMRSSRLCVAPVVVPVVLWSLPLFCSTESCHSLRDTIYVIIILYL
jgi:hypothetical protein